MDEGVKALLVFFLFLLILLGGLLVARPHRVANLAADCTQREGLWLADHEICLSRDELQQIRGGR